MQQLLVELKNTPEDAPQVPCSVSRTLNKDLRVPVVNMQIKHIPDIARISEQVKTPVGLDWIKNHCYKFKMEVGQFLPPLQRWVSLPRGS